MYKSLKSHCIKLPLAKIRYFFHILWSKVHNFYSFFRNFNFAVGWSCWIYTVYNYFIGMTFMWNKFISKQKLFYEPAVCLPNLKFHYASPSGCNQIKKSNRANTQFDVTTKDRGMTHTSLIPLTALQNRERGHFLSKTSDPCQPD